jgi:hypothetical protein
LRGDLAPLAPLLLIGAYEPKLVSS